MGKGNIRLTEIIKNLQLEVVCCDQFLDREIKGGYVSDLLSDVIANVNEVISGSHCRDTQT